MTKRLVFVDDEPNVLGSYRRMLRPYTEDWQMSFYDCPLSAYEHLSAEGADAVIVDIRMPKMTGLELLAALQDSPHTRGIPVIIVTGEADRSLKRQALLMGATDLLNKPVDIEDLIARLRNALQLKDYQDELRRSNELLEHRVRERTAQLEASQLTVIWRLGKAAEFRDEETGNHILRVGCYARLIAEELALSSEFTERLYLAAPLHDIGKIGIPDAVLLKPGKLDPEEWKLMQRHCEIGASILSDNARMFALFSEQLTDSPSYLPTASLLTNIENPTLSLAASIALNHHEKWNGLGYPRRLQGEQIPLEARIVAICDVFDALRSKRPYKRRYSLEETLEVLYDGRESHFDPAVYNAFMNALNEILQVEAKLSDQPFGEEEAADEACSVCRR